MHRPIRAEAFLGQLPLFAGLSAEVLTRLAAATTRRELRRGEILFREGDAPSGFYIVVHGRVALTDMMLLRSMMTSPGGSPDAIPEPSAYLVCCMGLAAAAFARSRRR